MPPLHVEFHADAAEEVAEARVKYAAQSPRTAARFVAEVSRAIGRIAEGPQRWPRYLRKTRFFRLRRFPYLVVYRIEADKIMVIALAHVRRKPGYWKRRL